MENDNVLVAIKCLTFNHEPYIRDCLDGFVMQKTNFKFVAIVHDDASTDKTADIIREYEAKYPDIIRPIYETENQYSKNDGSLGRIMNEAIDATGAKYVALCEGDDYWTNPLKLQKQVDVLEKKRNVMMVYSDYQTVNCTKQNIHLPIYDDWYKKFSSSGDNLPSLFKTNYPLTLTVMIRKRVMDSSVYKNIPVSLDYALFMCAAFMGDFEYINEVTGCYRITPTGMMQSSQQLITSIYSVLHPYFAMQYVKREGLKRISLKKDYRIKKTIIDRFSNNKMFLQELKKTNWSLGVIHKAILLKHEFQQLFFRLGGR